MRFGHESPTIPDLFSRRDGLRIGDRTYSMGDKVEWQGVVDERRIRQIWKTRKVGGADEIAQDKAKWDAAHSKPKPVKEAAEKPVTAEDLGI